jgi:hypothetical protein
MRLLSALLYLYPASFRADYGREMQEIVGARMRETTGLFPRIGLWLDTIADVVRNSLGVHFDILRQDLKYSIRTLARSPGFALTAILVTALGIGANTAAFSVADFVLIRPLPYRDADRLMKLWEGPLDGSNGRNEVSPALYQEWTKSTHSFESMGAHFINAVNLVGSGEPVRLEAAFVTGNLLPILGVSPARGRLLNEADNRDASSVILSYSVWQSRFGGDESILGRRLLIDGSPRVVVGVMPEEFHYPNRRVALWAPMTTDQMKDDEVGNTYWYVLAKLRKGVTHDQAAAEMKLEATRLRAKYPERWRRRASQSTDSATNFPDSHDCFFLHFAVRPAAFFSSRARTSRTCCSRVPSLDAGSSSFAPRLAREGSDSFGSRSRRVSYSRSSAEDSVSSSRMCRFLC